MATKWWKVKIKLQNGIQDYVFPADSFFLAKQIILMQFGNSIFWGPVEFKGKKPFMKEGLGNLAAKIALNYIFNKGSRTNKKKKIVKEDAPTNCAGSGHVAAIGVGSQGEPGVRKKKKKDVVLSMLRRKMKA